MLQQISDNVNNQEPDYASQPSALADSELLMRFVRHREPLALEQLIGKYGEMVMGVCTQILYDPHDADDVFQATFLILAQRADKIQNVSCIGAWLHQVAYRTAMRAAKTRHHRRKQQSSDLVDQIAAAELEQWTRIATQEEQAALHDELSHMPKRYREPLVLCYLQGMTQTEAADEMDVTVGVVKGRVTRGKQLLRIRLLRRGIALSVVFATTSSGLPAAQSASLPSLVSLTSENCATAILHGNSATLSTTIGTYVQQGVQAMNITLVPRLAVAATVLIATAMVWSFATGTGITGEAPESVALSQSGGLAASPTGATFVTVAGGGADDKPKVEAGKPNVDVKVVRYVGEKITERSAQRHSFEGLPESELVGWTDQSTDKGVSTIAIGFATGDEQGTFYELTLVDQEGGLPQFKAFRQRVIGSHGSIAPEEQYACEIALVEGVVAIQDWDSEKDGVMSGTVRGTLKLASSTGRIPSSCSGARQVDLKFWAKSKSE